MTDGYRYFFAALPPRSVAAAMGALRDRLGTGRSVSDDRLHVTLAITDDYLHDDRRMIERLIRIGGLIDAEPFRLCLDRLSASGSTIALRPGRSATGLRLLQGQLDRAMMRSGLLRDGWSFSPHATLAYRSGLAVTRTVPAFAWEVSEFVLMKSLLGKTQHVVLRRWPLVRRQFDLLAS